MSLRFGSNGLCQRQHPRARDPSSDGVVPRRISRVFWRDTRSSKRSATSGIEAACTVAWRARARESQRTPPSPATTGVNDSSRPDGARAALGLEPRAAPATRACPGLVCSAPLVRLRRGLRTSKLQALSSLTSLRGGRGGEGEKGHAKHLSFKTVGNLSKEMIRFDACYLAPIAGFGSAGGPIAWPWSRDSSSG
jgi:hypothetical protein